VWWFFLSSRRRHTRFSRDWSSDVCSSDLKTPSVSAAERFVSTQGGSGRQDGTGPKFQAGGLGQDGYQGSALDSRTDGAIGPDGRSEERRVGKGGGGRGGSDCDSSKKVSAD